MSKTLPTCIVLRDSREQQGWFFDAEEKRPGKCQITGTEVVGLKSGDYTLKGYEDFFIVERKACFTELYGNLINREGRERFYDEMERIKDVPYKYLIIESNLSNDIMSLGVPQLHHGPPCSRVVSDIYALQLQYGIVPIWSGDGGKKIFRLLIEHIVRLKNA